MKNKDYYDILGVCENASLKEIKSAYRKLAREYHPDMVEEAEKKLAEERFKEISEAYQILSDFKRRYEYRAASRKSQRNAYREDHSNVGFNKRGFYYEGFTTYTDMSREEPKSRGVHVQRVLALIVAGVCGYMIASLIQRGMIFNVQMLLPLLFGFTSIWFSETLSDWQGYSFAGESSGCVFSFVGWILLIVELIIIVIAAGKIL